MVSVLGWLWGLGVTPRQRLVYEDGWVVGTEESVVSVSTSSVGRLLTVCNSEHSQNAAECTTTAGVTDTNDSADSQ